jgi:hypothetical protein
VHFLLPKLQGCHEIRSQTMLSAKRTGMVSSTFLWKPPVTSRSQRVPFGCVAKLDMCPYAAGQNEAGKDANEAKDCMRLKRRITPRRTVDEGKTCPAAYTLSSDKHNCTRHLRQGWILIGSPADCSGIYIVPVTSIADRIAVI